MRGLSLRDITWVDKWERNGFNRLVSALQEALGVPTYPQISRKEGGGLFKPPAMRPIPSGGTFWMGSAISELNRDDDEGPRHEVTIERPFAMGIYQVTFEEYDLFASATARKLPSDEGWGGGRRPVINVTCEDADAYTKWLSEQIGEPYRLPSEAEWEYACRAGTNTRYWWGNDISPDKANWAGSLKSKTTEVGSYPENPWGLYDGTVMSGNGLKILGTIAMRGLRSMAAPGQVGIKGVE